MNAGVFMISLNSFSKRLINGSIIEFRFQPEEKILFLIDASTLKRLPYFYRISLKNLFLAVNLSYFCYFGGIFDCYLNIDFINGIGHIRFNTST